MKRPEILQTVAPTMLTFLKRDLLQTNIHQDKERWPASSLSISTRVHRLQYIVHFPDAGTAQTWNRRHTNTSSKCTVHSIDTFFLQTPLTLPLRNASHVLRAQRRCRALSGERSTCPARLLSPPGPSATGCPRERARGQPAEQSHASCRVPPSRPPPAAGKAALKFRAAAFVTGVRRCSR